MEASGRAEVIRRLRAQGLYPLEVVAGRAVERLSRQELAAFSRDLADLLAAGLSLDRALRLLASSPRLRVGELARDLAERLKAGQALSEALEAHPRAFDRLYVSTVRAGEAAGDLQGVLRRLAEYLEGLERARRQMLSASLYPMALLGVGMSSVAILLVFVIPRFTVLFEEMGQPLPLPLAAMAAMGAALRRWGGAVALGALGAGAGARWWTARRREAVDAWLLRLPVVGGMLLQVETMRLARTLGTLLGSGAPVLRCLALTGQVLRNRVLRREVEAVAERVRQGRSISQALVGTPFPERMREVVAVAEERGQVAEALLRLADGYQRDLEERVRRLLNALEPAMVLLMGVVIGGIVLTMLSAIFGLQEVRF